MSEEYTEKNKYGKIEYDFSKIHHVNDITRYTHEDTDITSVFFQQMRKIGGQLVTFFSLPIAMLGCGPVVTVPEGHRAALLNFGKLVCIKPPGVYAKNVGYEEYKIINVQIQTMKMSKQCVITKDGVQITIDAVCFFRIVDIEKAIFSVSSYVSAVCNLACYTLEVILGEHTLEDILQLRDTITKRIADVIEEKTQEWGIHITGIEIRDIDLPKDLIRVMASGAEASREGKAKIITAQAELEAAEAYAAASKILMQTEGAMQLRYLQTLIEIAAEQNSTIILPSEVNGLLSSLSYSHKVE